jgi:hypothetical protein
VVVTAAVPIKMTIAKIEASLPNLGLRNLGAFHPDDNDYSAAQTLILLGPAPNFWDVFTQSPEYIDKTPNPIDRWSKRVIDILAQDLDARPMYPFGGPPYAPFLNWALQTNRAHSSQVGMLVHLDVGLMVSYRGALAFDQHVELPKQGDDNPCHNCATKPCLTACPVTALTPQGYDVPKCKDFLQTSGGTDCMTAGCKVRRACPLSAGAGRTEAQSALHMQAFKGE